MLPECAALMVTSKYIQHLIIPCSSQISYSYSRRSKMPADLFAQLHIGIVEYAFRRMFGFPTQDLEWTYDDIPTTSSHYEVAKFRNCLLQQCRHSMLVHVTLYLGIDLHQFLRTMPGRGLDTIVHKSIHNLGNWCYAFPWSRAWIRMKCLTNFVFVCLGPDEIDEDPEGFHIRMQEAVARGQVSMLHGADERRPASSLGFSNKAAKAA